MRRKRIPAWLALTIGYGVVAGVSSASAQDNTAPGWGLPQLMQDLAKVKSASAQFTERKTLHMLTAPLLSSGTLDYTAPDRIEKITLSPVPERFVLDRETVTISGGADHRTRTVSLRRYPQIGGLVEGIRATLAGNLATLQRLYTVQLAGSAAQWQLLLRPRDARLAHFVRSLRIDGSQNRIDAIETRHSDGDTSDMRVSETTDDAR